jgi:hypothetical protein
MLPLECHTVARIRCDEYANKSQAPRDLHVAEQIRRASVRLAAYVRQLIIRAQRPGVRPTASRLVEAMNHTSCSSSRRSRAQY